MYAVKRVQNGGKNEGAIGRTFSEAGAGRIQGKGKGGNHGWPGLCGRAKRG